MATEVLAVLAALGGEAEQDLDKVLAIEAVAEEQRQQEREREQKHAPTLSPEPQP